MPIRPESEVNNQNSYACIFGFLQPVDPFATPTVVGDDTTLYLGGTPVYNENGDHDIMVTPGTTSYAYITEGTVRSGLIDARVGTIDKLDGSDITQSLLRSKASGITVGTIPSSEDPFKHFKKADNTRDNRHPICQWKLKRGMSCS